MKNQPAGRWPALAGLFSVLTYYAGNRFANAAGGAPSPFEAPAAELAAYFDEQAALLALAAWLYGLAAALLVFFAAGLASRLDRPADPWTRTLITAGLAGTAIYSLSLLLLGLFQLGLVGLTVRDSAAADAYDGLGIVWALAAAMLSPASVPMLAGFGLAARRTRAFSGLLIFFALGGAALGLIPPPEVIGPVSPAGASLVFVLGQAQPWLLLLWLLGTALVLRRSGGAPDAGEAASAGSAPPG